MTRQQNASSMRTTTMRRRGPRSIRISETSLCVAGNGLTVVMKQTTMQGSSRCWRGQDGTCSASMRNGCMEPGWKMLSSSSRTTVSLQGSARACRCQCRNLYYSAHGDCMAAGRRCPKQLGMAFVAGICGLGALDSRDGNAL